MSKKLGALLLMLALVLQLLPPLGVSIANAAPAPAGSFVFPDESYDPVSPRTTSDERVTLNGSVNNVNASSITYSVFQVIDTKGDVDPTNDQIGNSRENLTSNIYINGFSLQIYGLQLFPGLNRITFTGIQGGSQVSSSIYINYRNGPLFYDLKASLDGNVFPISELGTTVVESQYSRGKSSADISITGNAPNATKVTIDVNNSSHSYAVNSTNNYSFAASPINLLKGKNLVTISISNQNQTVKTTREIAFYNGDVTFYDVNIDDGGVKNALEYSPKFLTTTPNNSKLTGKLIVPNKQYNDVNNDGILDPHPDPASGVLPVNYVLKDGDNTTTTGDKSGSIQATLDTTTPVTATSKFFVYNFTIDATADLGSVLNFGNYSLVLSAVNEEKKYLNNNQSVVDSSPTYAFSILNAAAPYVYQFNYLPGYKEDRAYDGIEGVGLDGKNIYNLPLAVEVLVGNASATPATILSATSGSGITTTSGITQGALAAPDTVTKVVNGVPTSFTRYLIKVSGLPYEGSQTLNVSLDNTNVAASAKITLLFGPYVTFDQVFDNMKIDDDTTDPNRQTNLVEGKLDSFAGELLNISNPDDIHYVANTTTHVPQTIYFYINNTLVPLTQDGAVTRFTADPAKVLDALVTGENSIRYVYQGTKSSYEKTIKVYLVPTNLPEIPAKDTLGVFPYDVNSDPIPNDMDFTLSGSIYTTKKSQMKVYGTFDFIDLGTTETAVATAIGALTAGKYILKVDSTNFTSPITWDLQQNELQLYNSNTKTVYTSINTNNPASGITVSYDLYTQSFSFILDTQQLNPDGSSSVYNFFVYNSGLAGPRSSYRLEVDPIALPYDLVRPLLPTKAIVNQNFVEVVIKAPSAETVVVNKVNAEKIKYDADNDGTFDYDAYHAVVEGLKPGVNKITFTISNANDKTTDFFNITYAPTNIPGAQYLQAMGSTNKVFDGSLTLTFPKGTSLVRKDYNTPDKYKNQVFTGHKLLFAIANSEDGVVDRHDFETLPQNFDALLDSFGTSFRIKFPNRFTKASPVFWVDAGLADDLKTANYDPLTYGVDPYQFPNAKGSYGTDVPTYDLRPDDRLLTTSKQGSLTLSFDPSMRDTVGTIVTVFRYDVKNKYWENIGGVVDTKKNTITVPFSDFGYYVAGSMLYSFTDVTSHPYARNYMEAMYSKGIMNAAGLDEFGADMYVSRGEFARMLIKALDVPLNYELSKLHFDDVPGIVNADALWDFRYIETAAREGIIRGTQPRTFEPTNNLSREEAAVILSRALDTKLDTDANKINANLQKQFKDYAQITYYARAAVTAIAKKGYIQGSPVDPKDPKKGFTFEPQSSLLRSDAAIIVGKVLADLKRLPKLN
ncbi:S-layer homology domain-containing protein [Paenibacillus rhizovicinus]|uniref:S-layer homology domain-containing protein n=1 Tax=Paenibacillus rhizovicinus TaxID=2704463 RepID=A0A6C0P2T2_9BACL|nr:S-layer homology domain-containing protein [Paenibacillus rhizovicinus]QHW32576.1 S-layer homology domain-containing protein [Paenibacillus rhizovicinus]